MDIEELINRQIDTELQSLSIETDEETKEQIIKNVSEMIKIKNINKDRFINFAFRGSEFLITTLVSIIVFNKIMRFEETGSICSNTSRQIIQKAFKFFK